MEELLPGQHVGVGDHNVYIVASIAKAEGLGEELER
jgi:hypothetical protein